jgi:hypothetical protein
MRYLLAGLLLLAFGASAEAVASAQGNKASTPPACNCSVTLPSATPDTRGTGSAPLAVNLLPVPPERPPERDWSEHGTAWATIALAVITAGLAAATAVLARFTWKLWRSTKDLVEEGNETARRELRAYVALREASIHNFAVDEKPEIHLKLTNYGRTPAYRLRVTLDTNIRPDAGELPTLQEVTQAAGHLAPGADFQSLKTPEWIVSRQQYFALQTPSHTLFVYGIVRYVDTFGQERFTKFRLMTGGLAGIRDEMLATCGEGNETDDDVRLTTAAGGAKRA